MLPVPTVDQLADFSGRAVASYPPFASSALRQATLLMSINVCRVVMPSDPVEAELLLNGILELADDIVLKQPYKDVQAKPFTSETIMSYSYSKAAQKAQSGLKTGLMWFDLAVQKLSLCGDGEGRDIDSSSISVFEKDGITHDAEGRPQFLGPDALKGDSPLWYNTNSVNEVR